MQSVIRISFIAGFMLFMATFGVTLVVGTLSYGLNPTMPSWGWVFLGMALGLVVASVIGFTMIIVEYLKLRKSGLHMVAFDYDSTTEMLDDLRNHDLIQYFLPPVEPHIQ